MRPPHRLAPRTRCVHLRTKSQWVGAPDPDRTDDDLDTAVWWCERTCAPLGPDGSAAHPAACDTPGRPCHETPRRP